MNVLFLVDKWCANNPKFGFANHFDNLLNTFADTCLNSRLHTLHYDESYYIYNRHIDQILPQYCRIYDIKTIFLSFGGQSPIHPSLQVLEEIKKTGVKLVFIWYDNNPSDLKLRENIRSLVNLNVIIDFPRSESHDKTKNPNDLYLWTPESLNHFYPAYQDIDVSFIGSPRYQDRINYLSQLSQLVPELVIMGGQREQSLSFSAYANLIRRSKIGINFCKNPMGGGYEQVKGRVFEVIASKSLLLEEKNSATPHFFIPGEDYIEFENIEDLVDKIKYYGENSSERERIAESGYNKFLNNFTADKFWRQVMSAIK